MSLNLTRGLEVKGNYSNIDYLYGPYNSPGQAKLKIPVSQRGKGLTVGVIVDGKVVEYWWQKGTSNEDLVVKNSSGEDNIIVWDVSIEHNEQAQQNQQTWRYDFHGHTFSELQAAKNSGKIFLINLKDNVDGFDEILRYIATGDSGSLFCEHSFSSIVRFGALMGARIYYINEGENNSLVMTHQDAAGKFSIVRDVLKYDDKDLNPSKILHMYSNTEQGITTYQLEGSSFTASDFEQIMEDYPIVYIVQNNHPVGDVIVWKYVGRMFLEGKDLNPNENPPYTFQSMFAMDASTFGAVTALQVLTEQRNGYEQGDNQNLYFKFDFITQSTIVSENYESPMSENGIAPGDSLEEAFRKIEENIMNHSGGGGGSEDESEGSVVPPSPTVKKTYYKGSDEQITNINSESIVNFSYTNGSKVLDQDLKSYYYVVVRSSKNIRVFTSNNQNITKYFNNIGNITIDETSYKIFEFHTDTASTITLTITIEII